MCLFFSVFPSRSVPRLICLFKNHILVIFGGKNVFIYEIKMSEMSGFFFQKVVLVPLCILNIDIHTSSHSGHLYTIPSFGNPDGKRDYPKEHIYYLRSVFYIYTCMIWKLFLGDSGNFIIGAHYYNYNSFCTASLDIVSSFLKLFQQI